jgi:TolB-like protein
MRNGNRQTVASSDAWMVPDDGSRTMNLAIHSGDTQGAQPRALMILATTSDPAVELNDLSLAHAVREQLRRLEASTVFTGSSRLIAFLRFVVDETLVGDGGSLKEIVVGQAIYPREPPYDPSIDSVVRVEARRLRRKLETYYAGAGVRDPVLITMPAGSYKPRFMVNPHRGVPSDIEDGVLRDGCLLRLMVLPLTPLSQDPFLAEFADTFTDELITALELDSTVAIVPRSVVFGLRGRGHSIATLADEFKVDAVVHGIVRKTPVGVRLTIELANVAGFLLASERFDLVGTATGRLSEICRSLVRDLGHDAGSSGLVGGYAKVRRAGTCVEASGCGFDAAGAN